MNHKRTSEQNETQDTIEQFFKENFEDIHVPPQLKEDTFRKMRDKQAQLHSGKIISFNKHSARAYRLSALAAIFALLIFGTVFFSGPKVKISAIRADGLVSDYGAMYRAADSVRIEETKNGEFPFQHVETLCNFTFTGIHIYNISSDDGTLLDTFFVLSYARDEKTLTLVFSENQALAPPALYATQIQTLSGTPVFLGQDSQSKAYYAAWSAGKYSVAAQIENCSKRTALTLVDAALNMRES